MRLGHGVEYVRPGWKINVYIYDLRLPSIPDDVQSEVVKKQFEQAKGDILEAQKTGIYANVDVKSTYIIADADHRSRFLCATLTYVHKQMGNADSVLCVTAWNNKFVKFRLTSQGHKGSETEAKDFVEAWIKVLWPST
jgi:hypothetical protein